MLRYPDHVVRQVQPSQIAITTQAQAQYLLKALMATEGLLGRDRDPAVDQWVRVARVTLLDVIPGDRARVLLRETEALLQGIDATR
jgi:hypothetical protein